MPDEMEGGGLTPEAPTRPKIAPATLEQYFDSIEDPFRETEVAMAKGSPIGAFVAVFVFSLIPVIPYGLSKLVLWFFGPKVVWFRTLHFRLASFWFWWIVCFAISLSLLIIVSKVSGPSAEEKERWLSPAQMRFAYCYSVVDEIQKYKTNQLTRHIDAAVEYLDKTAESLRSGEMIGEGLHADRLRREVLLSEHQAGVIFVSRGTRPKWYRLRPETETILQGCREFMPKLHDRLKDRKDLNAVEAALTDLAAYEYTEIPELSDSNSETRFDEGSGLLLSFAQQVIALQSYRSEPLTPTPKEKLSRKLFLGARKLSVPFTHANVLVAFCAWLILMVVLFWGGFYLALRLFQIKMDSTIMTALIGGPIATAVTGATIPRLGKTKKRQE